MAITEEEFNELVGKLETFSKRNPRSYRLRAALFAILGYAYIFLVLAGLLTLIWLIVLFIVFDHHIAIPNELWENGYKINQKPKWKSSKTL